MDRVKRAQRERLVARQGGLCYYCGIKMIKPTRTEDGRLDPRSYTIEHLRSRFHPERGVNSIPNRVAACWQCNNRRAAYENALMEEENSLAELPAWKVMWLTRPN